MLKLLFSLYSLIKSPICSSNNFLRNWNPEIHPEWRLLNTELFYIMNILEYTGKLKHIVGG